MPISDSQRARDKIEEFISYIGEYERCLISRRDRPSGSVDDFDSWRPALAAIESHIFRLQPLIESIASELESNQDHSAFLKQIHGFNNWDGARSAAERLIGILDNQELHNMILGTQGPVLAAQGLHPWVWNAATDLWNSGHYRESVCSAANAIEQHAQLKIDRRDLTGFNLYSQLFMSNGPRDQRLEFSEFDKETKHWTSAHEGARHYGMGCARRIRNLLVHGAIDVSEQEALEYLAALSLLARWIDSAERANAEQ